MIHDFIVVGSGPSAAQAAQTLVEGGAKVAMLDVGITDEKYKSLVPDLDFVSLRERDESQYSYLLGTEFEAIAWDRVRVGAQLTPPRQFMVRDTARLTPLTSDSFCPMESLAYGGLGNGWGLGCFVYSPRELEKIGLNPSTMQEAYEVIANRIGIAAVRDDAAQFSLGGLRSFQKAVRTDINCQTVYECYQQKRGVLNQKGFFMGQPPMAMISEDGEGRKKVSYKDMEFYTDNEKSAYRPWMTVDFLKTRDNFIYFPKCLVERFVENNDRVDVTVYKTDSNKKALFQCRKLILAAGVLGTVRIVLRSFENVNARLPIICNHYCYLPCIHLRMLGKPVERLKTSLAQLVLFHDDDGTHSDVAVASLYSYRSLLLLRLVKEAPLNFADGRKIMHFLQSSLIIVGIHHPDSASATKFVQLVPNQASITHDGLHVEYSLSSEEIYKTTRRERRYMSALRTLGCIPMKRVYPGFGSSIHYGGTLPYTKDERLYSLADNGRLHGTKNVYVADGSGFRYLPAKGITFSLMSNAHLVARTVLGPLS